MKQVTLNFEAAMWVPQRYVLPTVQLLSRMFHWTQAVWQKIQELGLQVLYQRDKGTFKYLCKLVMLPRLLSYEIPAMCELLKENATSPALHK
ncbi:hypothetical protein pdam_00022687 [Pocillopora damicornis]|uniref:Uncharacterized protein n=1 Tax=Pocillopora damicornis TaxID=46731 RepID=A0A3M6TPZ4_POCDA|nr:hypothetical protein pdam_00022687 [Pocillopora damicornis]